LTNSALYIATDSYEQMNKLLHNQQLQVPNQDFSPLFKSLIENEQYLRKNAFYKVSEFGTSTCSKQECENLTSNPPYNTVVLYFNDRNIIAVYEDGEVILSHDEGVMLRHFLLKSSEEEPATRVAFSIVENIKPNTFTLSFNRLLKKLLAKGFPPFLHLKRFQNEPACYFDKSVLFYIMYRVDDEID
jgi:hypothetical protein